jgi:hypothetical protein
MKGRIAAAAALALLLAGRLGAAQADTAYTTIGVGASATCGRWEQRLQGQEDFPLETWVLGFLSGADTMAAAIQGMDILSGHVDSAGIFGWLDNYCRSRPLDSLNDGLIKLIIELKRRTQQ